MLLFSIDSPCCCNKELAGLGDYTRDVFALLSRRGSALKAGTTLFLTYRNDLNSPSGSHSRKCRTKSSCMDKALEKAKGK